MDTQALKEYLGIVVDMEKNIYLQEQLVSNLNNRIEKLKQPQIFLDPTKPVEPSCPKSLNLVSNWAACVLAIVIGGPILWFLTGVAILIISAIISAFGGPDSEWLILLSLVPPIIFALFMIQDVLSDIQKNKESIAEYHTQLAQYRKDLEAYHEKLAQNKVNARNDEVDRGQSLQMLQVQVGQVKTAIHECCKNLEIVYKKDVIFPKYRNLVMVCSLYEYICSGRCTTLEGHEGAYNILEMEIRMDRIVTQLDRVISQLGAIQQNQFMLYSAIQESNQRSTQILDATNRMADSLQGFRGDAAALHEKIAELQETSALHAYHAERVQKELAYMNRMDYLTGRNDGVFWNVPPT